ncbi:MAG: hypothetical protein HXY30_20135 [Pseudorhodoplanes sp.]|nr:hypothetical protein [Pseudorhodoplanes sp.]
MKPTRIGIALAALLICAGAIVALTQKYWRPAPAENPDADARAATRFMVAMLRENHVFGEPVAFPNVTKFCNTPQELREVREAVKALLVGAATSVQRKMLCVPHVRFAGEDTFVWEDPAACDALGTAIVALAASPEALETLAGRPPRIVNHEGRIEAGAAGLGEGLALARSRFDFARMSYRCEAGNSQIRITVPKR